MGREILKLAATRADIRIAHAYDVASVGEKTEGIMIARMPGALPDGAHVVIDFSAESALEINLALAVKANLPYVSGVTGFSRDPHLIFERAAQTIAVLHASNMSPAMNLLFALAGQAAKALPEHKRFISEIHHTAKKDSPSGTALTMAEGIHEATGEATAIQSLRMGDVVGEHHLIFAGLGERLEIIHRADSRAVFAAGAIQAAKWIVGKEAGVYGMKDVLGV
jgi:4-hydroxy-tetrahydrodipicolinate reductase